jgi:hypothetical protein
MISQFDNYLTGSADHFSTSESEAVRQDTLATAELLIALGLYVLAALLIF